MSGSYMSDKLGKRPKPKKGKSKPKAKGKKY
jgi:hypothetical protein